jgi:hypothetical protein
MGLADMETTGLQKNVQWRPIPSPLTKIDNGDVEKRLKTLRDTCYSKSPAEIYMQFNPTTIGEAAEWQFSKNARIVEGIRNASVFLPLMIMLISLGAAAQAYVQSPHAVTSSGGTVFFNLWINGFPDISAVKIFGAHIPLIINHSHWFTFSSVLIGDFTLLLLVITLTIIVQGLEGRATHKARKLTVWLNEEFNELCNASLVRSIGVGPGSEQPEWAVRVHEAIHSLHQVLQGVEGAVQQSQQEFARTIDLFTDVYQQQSLSVDKLLEGTKEVEKTVDSLGGIYLKLSEASQLVADVLPAINTSLVQMVRQQEQMTQQLKSMTNDIHQLAQPFRAAGLAEMARQIEKQQKENLNFLSQMEQRLTQSFGKRWWRKLFP